SATRSIRIEVLGSVSPRARLEAPDQNPKLWARCTDAWVTTFVSDPQPLYEFPRRAISRCRSTVAVSHRGLLPDRDADRVLLADGFGRLPYRRLADFIGAPHFPAATGLGADWLIDRLRARVVPEASPDEPMRLAGFRLSASPVAERVSSPAARALLVASAELETAHEVVVWVLVDDRSETGREWTELMDTLDIIAARHRDAKFDLWLWGGSVDRPSKEGEAAETTTVRLTWGPGPTRGWVRRDSQPGRLTHPELKFQRLDEEGNR
ncbi:MAG: hypothetical protein KDC38_18190, partial [Planctomycetes bacterium]|nr:hypothetical protein [Planctomycetota bacterium]